MKFQTFVHTSEWFELLQATFPFRHFIFLLARLCSHISIQRGAWCEENQPHHGRETLNRWDGKFSLFAYEQYGLSLGQRFLDWNDYHGGDADKLMHDAYSRFLQFHALWAVSTVPLSLPVQQQKHHKAAPSTLERALDAKTCVLIKLAKTSERELI